MTAKRFDPWQPNGGPVEMVEHERGEWVRVADLLEAEDKAKDGPWMSEWFELESRAAKAEAECEGLWEKLDQLRPTASDLRIELELMTKDRDALRQEIRSEVERLREIQAQSGVAEETADRLETLLGEGGES